jgi:hypothetical protein
MLLYHFKGRQEALKYTGAKYLALTLVISTTTMIANATLKIVTDNSAIWVFIGFAIAALFIWYITIPAMDHIKTEKELYRVSLLIPMLEKKIKDMEESNINGSSDDENVRHTG